MTVDEPRRDLIEPHAETDITLGLAATLRNAASSPPPEPRLSRTTTKGKTTFKWDKPKLLQLRPKITKPTGS